MNQTIIVKGEGAIMSKDFEKEIKKDEEIKNMGENITPEVEQPDEKVTTVNEEVIPPAEDMPQEQIEDIAQDEVSVEKENIEQTAETENQSEELADAEVETYGENSGVTEEETIAGDDSQDETEETVEEGTEESGEIPETDLEEVTEETVDADEKTEESVDSDEETLPAEQQPLNAVTPPKNQAFKKFLKKFRWPLIIAAIAIVLAAAITTTVLVLNAPKFFIRDAADFAEAPNKRQVVYVLKGDITVNGDLILDNALDLNLNGHTLTINGEFKRTVEGENTMNIGTLKKKQYNGEGKLVANKINITAPNTIINIHSVSEMTGNIKAKQINLLNDTVISQSKKLTLTQTKAVSYKKVSGELELAASSTLELQAASSLDKLSADATSSAIIYGKIYNEIVGGNEISMLGAASCPSIKNVKYLYYQQATATLGTATEVENLFLVTQLEQPAELSIERSGGTFKAVSSKVNNADLYVFTIKSGDEIINSISSASNVCDITEFISQPKTYTISVKASSTTPRINIPSAERSIEFNYSIKLQSPALSISQVDNKKMLTFPKVNFATHYRVIINGEEFSVEAPDSDTVNVDITTYVRNAGSYNIKVVASNPGNASFLDSDTVMTAYVTIEQLETPQLVLERDANKLNVSWQSVPNAKTYVLEVGDKKIVTTATSMSFDLASIADNTIFSLQAQAIGYYQSSAVAAQTYEYPQLEIASQPTYTYDGINLSVTMEKVTGAESYTLIINNEEVATSANAIFNVTANVGDTFKLVARAAYSREVSSQTFAVIAQ